MHLQLFDQLCTVVLDIGGKKYNKILFYKPFTLLGKKQIWPDILASILKKRVCNILIYNSVENKSLVYNLKKGPS